jgi:acetolactate synthase small subunit
MQAVLDNLKGLGILDIVRTGALAIQRTRKD